MVKLLGPGDPAWDDHLAVAERDVYHLAGYHAYAGGSGEGEPMLVIVGDRRRGLAWPYLLRRIDAVDGLSGTDATDVTSVYGYAGPTAWGCRQGDPFVAEAWTQILEVWRAQRAVAAFTRFHPLLGNAALAADLRPPADGSGTQPANPLVPGGPTVSIDCRLDDGAARQSYAKVLRQEIAAARRAGLVTEVDEDWSEVETFTRLYGETMARSGAAAEYTLAVADVRRLREALGGRLHLLVTRSGDTVGAACLFTELDCIVQAHLAGTNEDLRKLSPLKVLLDDARSWARDRGDHVLHLGGGRGGREDSLFAFKARFSARRHAFYTGRWILEPRLYRELVEARWRALASLDPTGEGFFPAYRARPASAAAGSKPNQAGGSAGPRQLIPIEATMNIERARPAAGLREVEPALWDALLAERGLHDVYFLRAYVEASCLLETGAPAYLHASGEKGDVVFACIVRDDPTDVTTPYGCGGPVALGAGPPVERFWELYDTWCRERGVVASFLRFHPLLGNQRGARLHVERLGRTVAWRLDPETDLVAAMHKHHRRVVRKAEREGLEARVEEGSAPLEEFVALYEQTMRRNAAADFYLFPSAYWHALLGPLGDCLVRVDVRRGTELHASLLLFATRPWLHYHLGGSSEEGRTLGASHLALLAAARWGQERGYERLHLGGGVGGREDSLFEFKRRFCPEGLAEAAVGKVVHDTARYRELSGADPAVLDGFFPAYRDPARTRGLTS